MRPKLQTGSKKGTYKDGDPHPYVPNRFFAVYRKFPDGSPKEEWRSLKAQKALRKRQKKYRDSHKQEAKEYSEKYRAKNRENLLEKKRKYQRENLAVHVARAKAYKYKKRDEYNKLSEADKSIVALMYEANQRVSECLGIQFHVDHIVPLSKGGKHAPHNLQIVPAKWNLSKSNSNSDVFRYNKQHTPAAKKLS